MIAYLVGTIEEKRENFLIIDVNGIGYELAISNNTLVSLPMEGETAKVLTYMQVKEDGVCLYGFANEEEKLMFLRLITVSGIGPKMAISILSGLKLSDLIIAILNEDANLLSKIKGLGKKSAERICLELKDKVSTTSIELDAGQTYAQNYNETALNDAVETLISLGVNKNEAYRLARSKASQDATAEEIILKVLKELGR
ncbi:MAG: Holliday junction branch migration protein RuvA [Clostridiales bacterium]|nr:Holliday junction branch migration protein RuvA [Clostridiales bacterium]